MKSENIINKNADKSNVGIFRFYEKKIVNLCVFNSLNRFGLLQLQYHFV